jgi:hypothetical protein
MNAEVEDPNRSEFGTEENEGLDDFVALIGLHSLWSFISPAQSREITGCYLSLVLGCRIALNHPLRNWHLGPRKLNQSGDWPTGKIPRFAYHFRHER